VRRLSPRTRGGLRPESQAALAEALAGKPRLGPGERTGAPPASAGHALDQLSDSSLKELEVARASAKSPEEKTAVEALARKAYSDTLTPAGNRTAYEDFLCRPRDGWHVALDLNDFKQVNDIYGHAVGDEALGRAGAVFSATSRANQGKLFRQGGDEFHAFFAMREQAQAFADQAKAMFDAMAPIRDDHHLSFSAGIGKSPSEADAAAAQAKQAKVARYGGDARLAVDGRRGHGESFIRAAGLSRETDTGLESDPQVALAPASLAQDADLPRWKEIAAGWMPVSSARTVLWTMAVILIFPVLWALGLVGSGPGGEFIRALLILSVITLLVSLIQRRRVPLIPSGWRKSP